MSAPALAEAPERVATLKHTLKEVFGYGYFRGTQEAVIHNVLSGNNTFVIMPTGAGKSLCYQLPALVVPGTAIVISPLIALMKNQVDQLEAFGVNAQVYNSTLTKTEMTRVRKDVMNGSVRLLYVAPESLTKDETIAFLQKTSISFVAIDEAHCISEWGHDFRPEYRKIRGIIDNLGGNIPIIALTATATPKVQLDIQKNLQMDDASVFKTSFNRTNLYYEVRAKHNTKKQLIQYVKQHKDKAGIIYCLSRKKVEEIAELLRVNDVRARPYHAGLDQQVRINNQDAFLNEECDVIVATIAFGMGIDKPDVRFVVHYDVPKSIEGYYQETGRGGRDGLEGNCLMFYSYDDILKLEKFSKDKPVTERDNAHQLLAEMTNYAESAVCRRRQLLHYFGETLNEDCGFCDNCRHPKERFEGQEAVSLALCAVVQTEARFNLNHVGQVLLGLSNPHIESYAHNVLPVYGQGKALGDAQFWHSVLRQCLLNGLLEKDIDSIGLVRMTDLGLDFIENPQSITLTKDHNFEAEQKADEDKEEVQQAAGHDEALFAQLKDLRKQVAKQKNLPPYVLFQDPSLKEMATTYPTSLNDLTHVAGVGQGKAQKFGPPFVAAIKKYVEDNNIETADDVVIKSAVNRSKIKIYIIQQVDKKTMLEDIASSKGIGMAELVEEIEHICYAGTRLNLDYYIQETVDEDKQDEIYDYFMTASTDNIAAAMQALGIDDFTEEEVRLVRVKFLSEVAN